MVNNEYKNTIPASLYAGITMVTMILTSYYRDWIPGPMRILLIAAVCVHAVHILVFLWRNVFHGVNLDTFVPSWFVTFNGIMVSTVAGGGGAASHYGEGRALLGSVHLHRHHSLHGVASGHPGR